MVEHSDMPCEGKKVQTIKLYITDQWIFRYYIKMPFYIIILAS